MSFKVICRSNPKISLNCECEYEYGISDCFSTILIKVPTVIPEPCTFDSSTSDFICLSIVEINPPAIKRQEKILRFIIFSYYLRFMRFLGLLIPFPRLIPFAEVPELPPLSSLIGTEPILKRSSQGRNRITPTPQGAVMTLT